MLFSKEAKIWIVQNYSSDKGLTQLCWNYIVNCTSSNKKTVPVVKAFKKVIVENVANGYSADNFCTRAKLCIQENGGHFEHMLKKRK